jgi:hypothetical protein
MGLTSKKTSTVVYNLEDLPALVLEENFEAAEEVIKREGIKIKYGPANRGRQRQQMTELRSTAYSLQRDMRAMGYDTNYLRDIIKSLSVGSSY